MQYCKLMVGLLLLAAGALTSAGAADSDTSQYQVELLVFRHLDTSRATPEAPRVTASALDSELERQLAQIVTDAPDNPLTADEPLAGKPERGWQPIVAPTRLLNREADKLRQLGAYELLGHLAWTQAAPDVAESQSIALAELGLDPQRAHGTINLYSKRYLHLAVDVTLGPEVAPLTKLQDPFSFPSDAVVSMQPEIRASRRIRLEQLAYFDAPEFGVIAVAERVPAGKEP